ncbi:MAG: chromate transporter [Clostridia bacterium]|nr:chromate transporter [Clostridia bacterium]
MILLELFWRFFQIGLFSFGGGYAVLPLIRQHLVDITGWITLQEFTDVVAISQMTPGPIALNAATFVGVRIEGVVGGIVATAGCITPSCIIVLLLARYFFKYRDLHFMQSVLRGLRPAVAAMITAAAVSIVSSALLVSAPSSLLEGIRHMKVDPAAVGIFAVVLFLLLRYRDKAKLLPLMIGAGAAGMVLYGLVL